MSSTLPPFPVDDVTLDVLDHALGASYEVDPDGTHRVVGADYSLTQVLEFLSGYDPAKVAFVDVGVDEYVGGPLYHRDDVLRALIAEVRRLRERNP